MTGDPVAHRRARIARAVRVAKVVGYAALLVAIVAFAIGLVSGFSAAVVDLAAAGLVGACIVLPLPIVLGYGIRAAEREDHQR